MEEGIGMERIRTEKNLNIPNVLTVLRIGLLPVIVWRFRRGDSLGALAVYLAAMLTDAADGIIARRFNLVTALGKLLDPLADKLSLITLIALFVWSGQIPAWVMAVVLIKEFVLVVGSVAALRLGVIVCALPVGKLTTAAFVVSTVMRFLGWKAPADMLLSVSLGLSMTALAWYMTAGFKKISCRNPCKV